MIAAISAGGGLKVTDDNLTLDEKLKRLSAEIGQRRREGLPGDDLIAQHRKLVAEMREAEAPRAPGPQALVVERISDMESGELRDTWGRLLTASKAFSPSMSWEWAYAWYMHFGKGKPVDIRVVKDSATGQALGLLPLMHVSPRQVLLRHEGYLPCRHLAPIGTRMGVEIDYTHPLVDAEADRPQVIRLLLESLAETGKPFVANHWDGGDESANLFITQARDLGFTAVTVPRSIAFDGLPGSFEDLVKQIPSATRRNLLRRYQREGRLSDGELILETSDDATSIIDRLPIVQRFSQAKYGRLSIWRLPWYVDYVKSCLELSAARGWPVLWLLRDGEGPIASVLGWVYNDACFITSITHDAGKRRLEPGHVLLARVLQQLVDRGVKWVDIHTAEGYKTHYFRQRRMRYDPLVLLPPGHPADLALAAMFLIRSMRERARKAALALTRWRGRAKTRSDETDHE